MNKPIKQHYVPQAYLNFFTDESNYFHVYLNKEKKIIRQSPKSTAFQRNFYTLEKDGNKNYEIEKFFAENVDNLYRPVIQKIENNEPLSENDKINLTTFIAFQYLRTPDQRDSINENFVKSYKTRANLIANSMNANIHSKHLPQSESETSDIFIEDDEIRNNIPKEISLKHMFAFKDELISILMKHDFKILVAPEKGEFITSDNPYCMIPERGSIGFGAINTVKLFPLTPKFLLILRTPKNLSLGGGHVHKFKTNRKDIRRFNQTIAHWSYNFIYSKNKYILNSIIQKIIRD
ncbi:DUF4238 domain-containing protein [Enterococcus gallinarum]|uniref:DUF4238 domain-containing protein n=1 Tax=Enterococcus TaxID=1350 RepID=UPI0012DF47FB|nr:DUF4238 domain-containing protein [Enterococcus gallinarum]MDT2720678.1 DUF4238 domain-containing protein [Enterococcus gallinarum]MDV7786548.1 DUF4238 domain-containing protein [Enterococcus gallinarum]QGR80768.1 DUF4238 domain-containing protein [Enterococcus gallinarum]